MKKKIIIFSSVLMLIIVSILGVKKASAYTINPQGNIQGTSAFDVESFYNALIDADAPTYKDNNENYIISIYKNQEEDSNKWDYTTIKRININALNYNYCYVFEYFGTYDYNDDAIYPKLYSDRTSDYIQYIDIWDYIVDNNALGQYNYPISIQSISLKNKDNNIFIDSGFVVNINDVELSQGLLFTYNYSNNNYADSIANLSSLEQGNLRANDNIELEFFYQYASFTTIPDIIDFEFSINIGGNSDIFNYEWYNINNVYFSSQDLTNAYNSGKIDAQQTINDLTNANNQLARENQELSDRNTQLVRENQELEQQYDTIYNTRYDEGFAKGLASTTDLSKMDEVFAFFKSVLQGFKSILDVRLFAFFSLGNILTLFVILLLFKWIMNLWR